MKLPRGLTRTPTGWRVQVFAHGHAYRRRYPATVPEAEMRTRLETARARMGAGRRAATAGTLAADITRYLLAYYQGRPGYDERARHLALWQAALGADTWRGDLTREQVSTVLHEWLASGLSPETCNKRRTALMALWHALDGRSAANPVRDVPKFRVPAPEPRGLAYPLIVKALKRLPRCKTRARLKVMAYTGARHLEVMRMRPEDWDEARSTLLLRATAKGAGTKPRLVPLSAEAAAALREFENVDAWGRFSWAPMARMWKAAAIAVGLPATVKPYDLRHSFGSRVYQMTGDLRATKELLGHASLSMTERYTLAAVPARAQAALGLAFPAKVPTRLPKTRKRVSKRS